MSKTLVLGAGGQIGQMVVASLRDSGCEVRAQVREPARFSEGDSFGGSLQGIELVTGDLEQDISALFEGVDQVVFSAGSGASTGFDKTLLVDLWGACRAIDCARDAGIRQFVMVSSRGANNPDNGPERIKPYLVAKHFADKHLVESGLEYVILQPGRLLDEPACGRVTTVRPVDPAEQIISRRDVADAVLLSLGNEALNGKTIELFKGETELAEALAAV
ncbi:SDR family oxidoreductase [Marinobacterium jannaschii]|uniref:SDR family oxidoreductase n=1 Tax=Marinobacterium jannaschii TaxID=64970 RepID=UPI000482E599|nr:SDR family oxidoreductase [Marinobacterium jannaschii]